MKKLQTAVLMLVMASAANAQRFYQPLGRFYDIEMQENLAADSSKSFSSVKPVMISDNKVVATKSENFSGWMKKHFLDDDFLVFSTDDYDLTVNPIFNFMVRRVSDDESHNNYYHNLRGAEAFGRLGNRIHFMADFYENQAEFVPFEDSVIRANGSVVPGFGYAKKFKDSGLDWAIAMGSFTVDVTSHFRVTLGNGKNFIGSGYRSMILSDLAFPCPYMRYDLNFGKFYYNVLWTQMKSTRALSQNQRYKFASYHVLGYKPLKNLELSLVEGVMWKNTKNGVYTYKPNAGMLLPVIFVPTWINGFDGESNVQVGFDFNYSPIKNIKLYGQANYQGKTDNEDELSNGGFQIGLHVFDLLFGLVDDLKFHLQAEYDISRVESGANELDFWSYGYPLTTLSVCRVKNFNDEKQRDEFILKGELSYKRFMVDASYYRNTQEAIYSSLNFRYFFNKKTKWNLYLSIDRKDCTETYYGNSWDNNYVSVGMQLCPSNFYFDF